MAEDIHILNNDFAWITPGISMIYIINFLMLSNGEMFWFHLRGAKAFIGFSRDDNDKKIKQTEALGVWMKAFRIVFGFNLKRVIEKAP